ncbi:MAG: uridine diphosphate-N-acetylglucosamine-binding protein YvcK [Candidatus Paceibacteria bacterium]
MTKKKVKKKVVVVGGGTGTHALLKGLKRYADQLDITVIVTMSDSGGSTGRLRDEFGQLPVGDARSALVALSAEVDAHDELLRELFLYRFEKGVGLVGHNFGNLLLTALTDILGSEVEAITTASRLLRVRGKVVPVTTDNVHLKAEYEDGLEVVGEHDIDEPSIERSNQRITRLSVTPQADINPVAREALADADLVILGPGDLYTSIIANCVVGGFKEAIPLQTPVAYVCNLMSRVGQTKNMKASGHIAEIAKYLGRMPDYVIVNTTAFDEVLLAKYLADDEQPVLLDCESDGVCTIHTDDFLATDVVKNKSGDIVRRSLIRHDGEKLATFICSSLLSLE